MEINYINFRIGQRVEWFKGPRKLRRTGTVEAITPGISLTCRTNFKTIPLKTVVPSANPRPIN